MASKGGPRPGAGRKLGVPNKATKDIRKLAQNYTPDAIRELAKLAGLVEGEAGAESEAVRKSALDSLLDRAHGKPTQHIAGENDGDPIKVEHASADEFIGRIARLAARSGKAQGP